MPAYPYLNNSGKIDPFFRHIQEAGVPPKVDQQYLSSIGFRSSNDRPLIPLAQFLGFLDSNNVPTTRWKNYRDKAASGALLAEAIREGYSSLFQRYPDAYRKDDESLTNFFATGTELGKAAIAVTARTFKTVCGLADFAAAGIPQPEAGAAAAVEKTAEPPPIGQPLPRVTTREPSLHIDIQIHIDPSASPEQIDQIFSSMARHLYRS